MDLVGGIQAQGLKRIDNERPFKMVKAVNFDWQGLTKLDFKAFWNKQQKQRRKRNESKTQISDLSRLIP